jgi:hypothetical protein
LYNKRKSDDTVRDKMPFLNRRQCECRYVGKPLEYSMTPSGEDEPFDGILFDISESGLHIITIHPLKEGETISIKSVVTLPSKTAVVRWCKNYHDLYSKIGLKFV